MLSRDFFYNWTGHWPAPDTDDLCGVSLRQCDSGRRVCQHRVDTITHSWSRFGNGSDTTCVAHFPYMFRFGFEWPRGPSDRQASYVTAHFADSIWWVDERWRTGLQIDLREHDGCCVRLTPHREFVSLIVERFAVAYAAATYPPPCEHIYGEMSGQRRYSCSDEVNRTRAGSPSWA